MVGFFRATLRTAGAETASQRLRELYGDVSLGGVGGYAERSMGDERFAVSRVTLDGDFEVAADVNAVTVAFSTPAYRWRVGNEDGDLSTAPALFQPGHRMSSSLSGRTRVTTVTFETEALTLLAGSIYGGTTSVVFDGPRAVSPQSGRAWTAAVELIDDAGLLENDLTRSTAYRSLGTIALEAFRLSGDREERSLSARAGLDAYRRAIAFIDQNLSLPITVSDVARAAGVSEMALSLVFAAHSAVGWTAEEQLRRGRLAAAHLDLVNGDPSRGTTVAGIAARWGFPRPARFAALYRSVYGVSPKWVLDR